MKNAEVFRLRSFVDSLGEDELLRVKEATDFVDIAKIVDGNPKAVMLESVGPERSQLAANVVGSRARLGQGIRRSSGPGSLSGF